MIIKNLEIFVVFWMMIDREVENWFVNGRDLVVILYW